MIQWFVGYTFNPNFNNSHFDRLDFHRSLVSGPRSSPRREFGDGEGGREGTRAHIPEQRLVIETNILTQAVS